MKLEWVKCPCGVCGREAPANFGDFYEGSGFNQEEKKLMIEAFESLEREQKK